MQKGADISCHDLEGRTPLHHACLNGLQEILILLCTYGANLHALNFTDEAPFDLIQPHDAPCYMAFVRCFAIRTCTLKLEQEDEDFIGSLNPKLHEYYTQCVAEVLEMTKWKITNTVNLLQTLASSNYHENLAKVIRTESVYENFSNAYATYTSFRLDINTSLKSIVQIRVEIDQVEYILSEIFEDVLPCVVINILAKN